jgi:hypothetical protein
MIASGLLEAVQATQDAQKELSDRLFIMESLLEAIEDDGGAV